MIAWSLEAARESGCFDHIIVSTDDEEIADVAQSFGAEVPFRRPAGLSDDHATSTDVFRHAVTAWEKISGAPVPLACGIYATAPFLRAEDLRTGKALMEADPSLDFAFSVTSFPFPIQRALKITDEGHVAMVSPEHETTRSQDLPERYHDAGQFYWFRPESLARHPGFFNARSAPVILPRERVQDIDTPEDWESAELAHEILKRGEGH
jgi:N-acylneuraminate cytidylyltransferase